jgi:hypothetical protein
MSEGVIVNADHSVKVMWEIRGGHRMFQSVSAQIRKLDVSPELQADGKVQ